ncbi:MAG TPA: NAD-dependent epimerase/dehydratase family protein, partial [Actinospica sp.]|nr:NAD-dependent epimerase/dehydratase family protein [Actinospica sp.]
MRVLVTGAFGFLGTALTRRLAASGHEVRALTSRPAAGGGDVGDSGFSGSSAVEVVRGDVRD